MADTAKNAGHAPSQTADASGRDRRQHQRIAVTLHVRLSRGDKTFRLVSENLSLGGIFLKGADSVCAEGETIQIQVSLPTLAGTVSHAIVGTVVQIAPKFGAGIRFDWSDATRDTREQIEQLLIQLGMGNDALLHSEEVGLSTDAEEETR